MRWVIVITLILLGSVSAALAQEGAAPAESTPILRVEVKPDSVSVGQPVVLRISILVPTWMPEPPVFPSFDAPNMIVRLPERASGPISETVQGETWSGVSRAYRMYPMVAGTVNLTGRALHLTYADPDATDPITLDIAVPPVHFEALVPKGAENLDPLIVADGLELEQTFEGPDDVLTEGEAVKRIVTAHIKGSSALFLPDMIDPLSSESVQGYPSEPVLTETENRGVLSGQRIETATYVAQYSGTLDLPKIEIQWFNASNGKVETATVEARSFTVNAPEKPREPLLTRRQTILLAIAALGLGGIGWMLWRWVWPVIVSGLATWRAHRLASEAHAAKRVKAAISVRDLQGVATARSIWEARLPHTAAREDAEFTKALLTVGAAQFRDQAAADWPEVALAFDKARSARLDVARHAAKTSALPPLNPF